MKRKALSLAAGVCAAMIATAAPALAGNTATNSAGAIQVGAVSASPSTEASNGGTSASFIAPVTVGSGGDNTASNSTGAVQVGGGNRSHGSTGTAQVSGTHAKPSATAGSAGRSASVSASAGASGSGNSASGSTGAAQVGGGNTASGSTGAVQSSSPTGGATASAGGASASVPVGFDGTGGNSATGTTGALQLGGASNPFAPNESEPSQSTASAGTAPLVPTGAVTTPGTATGAVGAQQAPALAALRGAGTSRTLSAKHTAEKASARVPTGTLPFTGLALGGWLVLGASLLLLGIYRRRSRAALV